MALPAPFGIKYGTLKGWETSFFLAGEGGSFRPARCPFRGAIEPFSERLAVVFHEKVAKRMKNSLHGSIIANGVEERYGGGTRKRSNRR